MAVSGVKVVTATEDMPEVAAAAEEATAVAVALGGLSTVD